MGAKKNMNTLTIDDFDDFFQALHHRDGKPEASPYSWQKRLAGRAIAGDWPGAIDLPTGSGKTACIDAAVFALACQAARPKERRAAPRRIFFSVNRRVIVDEAHQRARRIAERLFEAERGRWEQFPILSEVAFALRTLAGTDGQRDAPPLDVIELRGGIYRDNRWARSVAQPIVICTTIDQLGSRLLFRGYGVSTQAAPIQAALIAYDSLVLLDEAHISQPFYQTLQHVGRYLDPEKWAEEPIGPPPMMVVPMTATPPAGTNPENVIRLDDADRKNPSLDARLKASKPVDLEKVPDVAKALVERAGEAAQSGPVAVGIIVNRVATARKIYAELQGKGPDAEVELVIGAMRPIDRDRQTMRLEAAIGPGRPTPAERTSFVVATQCLEVGADYDFDILLTECASLDALRQRFGRLNRAGRDVPARGLILVREKDVKPDDALDNESPLDPIYGNALARTWNWLWENASLVSPPEVPEPEGAKSRQGKNKAKAPSERRIVDFGIDAFEEFLAEHGDEGRVPESLLAPSAWENAPVMLPAYVDFWCQTSPIPAPDPEVSLFLHGLQRGEPDVQVCWRADLIEDEHMQRSQWTDVVAMVPPSSAECMTVPLSRVRRWLVNEPVEPADRGDLLEVAQAAYGEEPQGQGVVQAVVWRGVERSLLIEKREDLRCLRPGDTVVLPANAEGWDELGHIPTDSTGPAPPGIDVAEEAFRTARALHVLRLHPTLLRERCKELLARVADDEVRLSIPELRELLSTSAADLPEGDPLRENLLAFVLPGRSFICKPYPDHRGLVLISRQRLRSQVFWFPALDEGNDDSSRIGRETPVSLSDHTDHVRETLERSLGLLHTTIAIRAFQLAAERHDWGKADERFQAMLLGSSRTDAWLWPGGELSLLAKSDGVPLSPAERRASRDRSGLPEGFRHEMLSVQLAERAELADIQEHDRDLILHLIAAHHGYARPFAPVVLDDDLPKVELYGAILTTDDRRDCPPHRLDSGIAERFWSLTRRYGWWGLAYLEALLRLADQQASADEDDGSFHYIVASKPSES